MKNKLFIITLSILFLFSCNKSILDKQPMDMISDAVVWNDPTLIESFLAMQYALTTVMVNETRTYITSWGEGSPIDGSWNIENSVHAAGPLVINQIADEAKAGWNIVNVNGYKAGGLSVSGGLLEWWEYSYYIIRNLNKFVARVPTAPIDGTLARTRAAEARFLRAFNYFAMVKRYGGVPLITRELQLGDPESDL